MNPVSASSAPQPRRWLVKQEPEGYPFARLVADGRTAWTGVRNAQARNYLRAMSGGDEVLYYHTGDERAVVGLAQVAHAAYPDPTAAPGESWLCVDLAPVHPLAAPVSLSRIKADPVLAAVGLVRQPRLSVMPLQAAEFDCILALSSQASSPNSPLPP